jgi:hypothetical protein
MTKFRMRMAVVLVWCGACGGVDDDKLLTSLGDSEILKMCERVIELVGPPRTVHCGSFDLKLGNKSIDDCIAETLSLQVQYPICEATVGDNETCAAAIASAPADELCSGHGSLPLGCAALLTIECGGGR